MLREVLIEGLHDNRFLAEQDSLLDLQPLVYLEADIQEPRFLVRVFSGLRGQCVRGVKELLRGSACSENTARDAISSVDRAACHRKLSLCV